MPVFVLVSFSLPFSLLFSSPTLRTTPKTAEIPQNIYSYIARGRDHLVIIKLAVLERPPPNLESLVGADNL